MRVKLKNAFDNFLIMPTETDLGIYEGSEGISTCSYYTYIDSEVNVMIETVMVSQDLMNYLILPGLTCNSAGTT